MNERAEAGWPIPERRQTDPRDDRREVRVALGEHGHRAFEPGLVESNDQTTVPWPVNPAAGRGSNGRPSAPRSHARAFSPSEGR